MTIKEVYDIFTAFVDDQRDPYIINALFSRHINTAMVTVMKNHFYADQDPYKRSETNQPRQGYAQTQYKDEDFKELIYPLTLSTDANGRLLYSDIELNFPNVVVQGEDGVYEIRRAKFFHLASVLRGGKKSVWRRHNDHSAEIENPYKKSTDRFPKHRYFRDYIEFLPKAVSEIEMVAIRYPEHIWYDAAIDTNNRNPELSDSLMMDVIFRALTYAGINIREAQIRDYMEREEMKL